MLERNGHSLRLRARMAEILSYAIIIQYHNYYCNTAGLNLIMSQQNYSAPYFRAVDQQRLLSLRDPLDDEVVQFQVCSRHSLKNDCPAIFKAKR